MSKTEEKIQVVKNMINSCITTSAAAFSYGNIPNKRFNGAKNSYAPNVKYDDVIGLIDTTVFGGGERGILITTQEIFIKEMLTPVVHSSLSNAETISLPRETYYDLKNLSLMILKLQEIENREEHPILNTLGNIFNMVLEEGVKAAHNEFQSQMDAAEEEALELLENLRDNISGFRDAVSGWIIDYDDIETYEEVCEQIIHVISCSCLFNDNFEKYKSINGLSEDEEAYEVLKSFREIVEDFDELINSEFDTVEPLSKTVKRFNNALLTIYEEMKDIVDDDAEIDWENYYERTQNAVKTFKKKLNSIVIFLSKEIESSYDDEN